MRVLVACEFSGIVREAFRARERSRTYRGIAEAFADQWGSMHPKEWCRKIGVEYQFYVNYLKEKER